MNDIVYACKNSPLFTLRQLRKRTAVSQDVIFQIALVIRCILILNILKCKSEHFRINTIMMMIIIDIYRMLNSSDIYVLFNPHNNSFQSVPLQN